MSGYGVIMGWGVFLRLAPRHASGGVADNYREVNNMPRYKTRGFMVFKCLVLSNIKYLKYLKHAQLYLIWSCKAL